MIKRTLHIGSPCHLKCANSQLVVCYSHVKGQATKPDQTVPIEDVGILVLEHHQITLTHYLLDALTANNVAVVTCNATHHPSGLLLPLEGNTLQSERFKHQINATEPLKKQLWQQTVKAKITNQAALLQQWNIPHLTLSKLATQVLSGDTTNTEATAAAHYWQHLFPPAWQFFRHREGPPPNNLLNYGYAILRAATARAIVGAGLLPTMGIFHRNRYNAYCLADDIMEPYRPFVDAVVRHTIHHTSHVQTLSQPIKVRLLQIPAIDVQMGTQTSPLMVALQRTAASVAQCFAAETRKILYPTLPPNTTAQLPPLP